MTMVTGHCIFCDTYGALTEEDPIPHWIDKVLKEFMTGPLIQHSRSVVDKGKVLSEYSRKRQTMSVYKVPTVCQRCNGGWMSRLENQAKPILRPMILGHRSGLSSRHQEVIARWMMLKVLFFDLIESEDRTAASEDFHHFYENGMPPARFECWIARYEPGPIDILFHVRNSFRTRIEHEGIPPLTPHAQNLTLVFGNLVLQSIFVNNETQGYPPVFSRTEPEPHVARIWPSTRTVDWPPPLTLTPLEIELFATGVNSDDSPT
jgi:hypothetical protein